MSYGEYLTNGMRILGFKQDAVTAIKGEDYFHYGLITISILAAFMGIAAFIAANMSAGAGPEDNLLHALAPSQAVALAIGVFVAAFIFYFIGYGILHLSARMFGGTANIKELFGVSVAVGLPLFVIGAVVTFIAYASFTLGGLLDKLYTLYSLAVSVFIVKNVYDLSTGKSIGAVLVPIVVVFLLIFTLAMIRFGALASSSAF